MSFIRFSAVSLIALAAGCAQFPERRQALPPADACHDTPQGAAEIRAFAEEQNGAAEPFTQQPLRVCYDTREGAEEVRAFGYVFPAARAEMSVSAPMDEEHNREAPEHTETLPQALARASALNKSLEAALHQADSAEERYNAARYGMFPSLSGDVSYGPKRQYREGAGERDLTERSASLRLRQDIWTGGRYTAGKRRERALWEDAKWRAAALEREIAERTVAEYVRLYTARRLMTVLEQSVTAVERILRGETLRRDLRLSTETDVARAEARLAELRAGLSEVKGGEHIARSAYRQLTGFYPSEETVFAAPEPVEDVFERDPEEARRLAAACSPALQAAQARVEAARQDVKAQAAALLPSLAAEGLASYREGADIFSRGEIRDDALLLRLNVPIFNKGAEYAAIREARAALKAAGAEAAEADLDIRREVTDALYKARAAKDTLAAREAQKDAAERAFNGMIKERAGGVRSAEDVLEAEYTLRDAEAALLRAQSDTVTASRRADLLIKGYGGAECGVAE